MTLQIAVVSCLSDFEETPCGHEGGGGCRGKGAGASTYHVAS